MLYTKYTPLVILFHSGANFVDTNFTKLMKLYPLFINYNPVLWRCVGGVWLLGARKRVTHTQEVGGDRVNNVEGGVAAGAKQQLLPLLPIVWLPSYLKERSQEQHTTKQNIALKI